MAVGRASLLALFEVIAASLRFAVLWAAKAAGSIARRTSQGQVPVIGQLVMVGLVLLFLPPAINAVLDLGAELDVWGSLGIESDPSVGQWWTAERVIIVTAVLVTLRWLIRARERVIVQEFVDYTSEDEKAVSGLAILLVTELSRLRELYGHVNEQLSTPLSVGVRSGSGGPGEPGSFLSVRADEVTEVLSGAVASEAKVSFAGFTIPIGFVLSVLGRLARGPRVIGSVHFTEAGGGPTVTAQIVGRGKNFTWRIDAPPSRDGRPDKAFLDPMVAEIACRMFTDMTLRGSVRWQAIRAFTAYLEHYWESLRTPKNRASYLKKAEARLLEAVAEDETFDLAFYNLGVVYSQLAQAEYLAAEAAEYPRRKGIDPEVAYRARTQAAQAAFMRAIALNRSRWEAIYALAVHEFAEFQMRDRDRRDDDDRLHSLTSIIRRCDRVLELNRWNAQAYDLRGMAQIELGKPAQALKSHRRAVTRSWSRLCRAEYSERKTPPTATAFYPARKLTRPQRSTTSARLTGSGRARAACAVGSGSCEPTE